MSERVQSPMKAAAAAPARRLTHAPARVLQRQCSCGGSGGSTGECEQCKKKKLQRRAVGYGPEMAPSIVHQVLRSPGQPLDPQTRALFEPRFGHDFSKVRVHTDAEAAESAHAVNALAYTVGPQIVFGPGQYRPGDASGKRLLAHELTHVVQQGSRMPAGGSLRVGPVGDSHEQEAERTASATESTEGLSVGHASTSIQRQSADPSPNASGATDQSSEGGPGSAGAVPQPETCKAPPDLPTDPDLGCNSTKDPVTGVFRTVNFVVDKYDLIGDATTKIHESADEWRKRGSPGKVRVDGYASPEYQCEYNWRLSCHRARAVANELKNPSGGNVPEGQIDVFAHGESLEAGNSLPPNRRATISLPSAPSPPPAPPPPAPVASKCPTVPTTTPATCADRHNAYCEAQKCFPANSWLSCVCAVSGQICDAVDAFEFKGVEGTALQACFLAESSVFTSAKPIHDKGDWFLRTNQCIWGHWRKAFDAVNDPSVPIPSGLTPEWAAAVTTCRRDGTGSSSCCKAHVTAEQSAIDTCGGYPSAKFGKSPTDVPGVPGCSWIASKLAPGPPFTGDFGNVSDRIKFGDLVCKC
jgi:outer membrane protein OmpA-like peptidoglycan-associated protein